MAASRNKPSPDPVLHALSGCLARHASPGDRIAVAYSGGLDSTVLLHAASRLASKDDLFAIHVHHGLSPNAERWADFCQLFASDLGIPLDLIRVKVRKVGSGLEAAARDVRHRALEDADARWLLIAHHADDQAETVLHNLLRGAGVRGAAAMRERHGKRLRPFLALGRSTLLDYAQTEGLRWVDDETNLDSRFTRNFLRSRVMPAISERFPRANEQLAAAAARFGEAAHLLDDLALIDLAGARPEFPLPLKLLRDLPEERARNLLRAILNQSGRQSPDDDRLREFVRQVRTAGPDRHPRLDVAGYSLRSTKGRIEFESGS